MTELEVAANGMNAVSILLAGRNSTHTWWTGILGCALFGWLFASAQLYADATLQIFFIGTSAAGWWAWARRGERGQERPIATTRPGLLAAAAAAAVAVALGYGWLLHRFTDAWQPFLDSLVLTGSALAQLLLMARRVETWPCWIVVNVISVPLFWTRGLHLTALLYAGFWLNAVVSLFHWRRLAARAR